MSDPFQFTPLSEVAARPEEATMAGAVCSMRRSFEQHLAAQGRQLEDFHGAVRELTDEVRAMRLKSQDYTDLADAVSRQAEVNTKALTMAVERFEAAIGRLADRIG